MIAIPRALPLLLGACTFATTIITSVAVPPLPNEVFWDNNDWPSDLISVGDFNSDDDDNEKVLDFLPLEHPKEIFGQTNLNLIVDDPTFLTTIFNETSNGEVEVKTWNGAWVGDIHLPDASDVPNLSEFQLTCGSTWGVNVHYNNGDASQSVSDGNFLILAVFEGVWITEDEYNPTPNPTEAPTEASENKNPPLLEGTILFAQSQIIPSKHGIDGDSQPHLTALRKTLVMLRPYNIEEDEGEADVSLKMNVRDANGMLISSDPIEMKEPYEIPKQDGWIELGDIDINDIEFPTSLTDPYVIKQQSNLDTIKDDKEAAGLTDKMNNQNKEVEIQMWDGSWVGNIYLPEGSTIPANSKLQLTCDSGYHINVYYPNTVTGGWRYKKVTRGQIVVLILVNNIWMSKDDLDHNKYVFGHGFFTATLEAEWVKQGMTLEFTAASDVSEKDKVGILHKIKIGGVTELVITAIDVGMLTPPRNQFKFRNDETAQREYFETAPVSRLVVAQYETMYLTEIMLPSGKRYTDVSDTDGGWHTGDMRGYIGKLLLSHGIDLANYGISSSKGASESSHPFTCALLAAHNTVGMYQNGRQVHGGSGGNGMITLDSSIGNEMSHEVGHNYGLGHYVGGFNGSVHRPSNKINSSWGWDSKNNIFIPNFASNNSGKDQCLDDKCQLPYMGKYRYGTDSMAGGYPMWGSNRFTMYTPYVAKRIQKFLESRAVWDPTSSTGFRIFDQASKEMKEFVNNKNGQKVPRMYRVPVTTIVGYYDPSQTRGLEDYVYPAMHGAYGFVYNDDGGSSTGTSDGCELVVKTNGNSGIKRTLVYTLTKEIYDSDYMNKFHVNVASEDRPYSATIYCFNELRTFRALDGPNQTEPPLTFTVNGIAFDTPTTSSPTPSPTSSPSTSPTGPLSCAKHTVKKKCNKDKGNLCKWKKILEVKCFSQPCKAVKKKNLCKKGGCKWKKKNKECVDPVN